MLAGKVAIRRGFAAAAHAQVGLHSSIMTFNILLGFCSIGFASRR